MTFGASASARGRVDLLDWRVFLLTVVVAGWTLVPASIVLGWGGIPHAVLILLAFPACLTVVALISRSESPALSLAAGWVDVVAAATLLGATVTSSTLLSLAIPAMCLAAVLCARFPAAAVVLAFALTGGYGSLKAFVPSIRAHTVVDLILVGLVLGSMWTYLVARRGSRKWLVPGVSVLALYVFVTFLEVPLAQSFAFGADAFRLAGWYMLAALVIAYLPWGSGLHERVARGVIGVAFLVGGYATLRWIIGPAAVERATVIRGAGHYVFLENKLVVFGSLPGGHSLSAWTSAAIPFCLAAAVTMRDKWRFVAAAAGILCFVALLGSEVRAGVAGVGVGSVLVFALYLFSRGFRGLHLGVSVLAALAIFGMGYAITHRSSSLSRQRYSSILDPTHDRSFQLRLYKWRDALSDIQRHPFGHGLGQAGSTHLRLGRFQNLGTYDIDNSYLKMAFEQGFVIAGLFALGALLLLIDLGRQALLTRDRMQAGIAMGACGTLASFLVVIFTGDYIEDLPALTVWIIVGLGVGQFAQRSEAPVRMPRISRRARSGGRRALDRGAGDASPGLAS